MRRKGENRVEIIDALRGLSILLMVVYHLGVDLVLYGILPDKILYNTFIDSLQFFFACVFILVSGVSARFSRNNMRRGLVMLGCGMVVTAVTYIFDPTFYVKFGILHFLGSATLIYAAAKPLIDKIPTHIQEPVFFAVFLALQPLRFFAFDVPPLCAIFGIQPVSGFASSDYFPVLPYLFLYLFGTAVGYYIKERRFPPWFYRFSCPPLSFAGRNTLWIYLLHQPICIGITTLILHLMRM
jgi:uncharacterized membrane protein